MTREKQLSESISAYAAQAWDTFHGSEAATPAEHREFADWMARSPEHVEAYLRVARAMATLKSPEIRWPDTSSEVLVSEAKASPAEVATLAREPAADRAREERARSFQPRFAYALVATLVLLIGFSWFAWLRPQRFETAFGEQRSVLLADGSRVTLNTASIMEVDLKKDHRVIRLLAGEALFDVAHDPSRPFDVYTGNSILRAVGTRFDVDMRRGRTSVTIVEGIVSLTHGLPDALPRGNTPLLEARDRVVIGQAGPGTPEHGVDLDAVTAWTQRKLIFERRPLGEVAEEFNRYNRGRIVIQSERLRTQEITGVFHTNDPDSFLSFLSGIPGVQIRGDSRDGQVVVLEDEALAR